MAKSNAYLISILIIISSLSSPSQGLTIAGYTINQVIIDDVVYCRFNGTPNPVSNATVYLTCGGSTTRLVEVLTDTYEGYCALVAPENVLYAPLMLLNIVRNGGLVEVLKGFSHTTTRSRQFDTWGQRGGTGWSGPKVLEVSRVRLGDFWRDGPSGLTKKLATRPQLSERKGENLKLLKLKFDASTAMDLLDGFSAPPSSTDASPPCTNLSLTSDLVAAPLPTSSPQFPPSSSPELPVSTPSTVPEGPNGTVPCVSDCVNGTGPHGSDVVTCDNQSPPDTGATASASHDSGITSTVCTNALLSITVPLQSSSYPIAPPDPVSFVPSLGSWAKPLYFKPSATPPEPSTPSGYDLAIVGIQLAVMWPSLNDEILNKPLKGKQSSPSDREAATELKADGTLRFPWAARLSPQSRNLYRVATPTYRLDGTPEVYIPSKLNVPSVVSAAEISQSLQSDLEVAPPLFTVSSDVSVDCQSTSNNTLSPLVDSQSTPITAAIMDSVPSNIINKEVQTPSIVDILTTSLQK
ncbi:hypothetical protein HID58_034760 [Brassica napus]|uniref:Uncharacterized protein n=1 Tax=Brassica napus TaxID=3708 RepID=A0ABQ8C314_BRANA|nr:hypothetical protein HID58_034760 [Brassica napus]